MIHWLVLAELVLPLALLASLLGNVFRSRLTWCGAVLAAGALLAWLASAAMWLVAPWWMLSVYTVLWAAAVAVGFRRWSSLPNYPRPRVGWLLVAPSVALTAYAVHGGFAAARGRAIPAGETVSLQWPFGQGRYLVLNGGSELAVNAHLRTQDPMVARFARWRGNAYAIDIVAVDRFGLRARGLRPASNESYATFGRPVLAPCGGTVVIAVDGLPDMIPPRYDSPEHLAGNHVILECGAYHVVLAHFRRGTVLVRAGDSVATGQPLAEAGNSGGTDEAHLHVHAQRPGTRAAPMGGDPLPITFFGRFLVRGARVQVP